MQLSTTQKNKIAQFSRTLLDSDYSGGFPQMVQDIFDLIEAGSIGITATAADVDSLALDGGHFGRDPDNTTGLTFAYKAGRFWNGIQTVNVAAGTVLLTTSTTNYVEVDAAGTVSANTSGFTATSMPLYQVVTGAGVISSVTNKKNLLTLLTLLTGARVSTALKTEVIELEIGALSATDSFLAIAPNYASKVTGISIVNTTDVTADDTNYWTFSAVNKGPAGTGTTALLAASDANTTKATGGSSMSDYVNRDLTLHGTTANLDLAAGDVLVFTATKAASATALSKAKVRITLTREV